MKKILFVCVHNSGRSQMGEGIFNNKAQGCARAISAGTKPAEMVNPVVATAMREIGIEIGTNKPKKLTWEMVKQSDKVISMGCMKDAEGACPAGFLITQDWLIEDPKDKNIEAVRLIRDEIIQRVTKLVEEICFDK